MEANIQTVTECFPMCRVEFFESIVKKRIHGEISRIWHHLGHIFISSGDKKLFTFDCKPVVYQHNISSGCLDIENLKAPLLDVLFLQQSHALLAYESGLLQFWKFSTDGNWSWQKDLDLSSSQTLAVTSIAFSKDQSRLIWCEKRKAKSKDSENVNSSDIHCVFTRHLVLESGVWNFRRSESAFVLIYNITDSDVVAVGTSSAFVATKFKKERVTAYLTVNLLSMKCSLYLGENIIEVDSEPDLSIDFCKIIQKQLSVIMKLLPGNGDFGIAEDRQHAQIGTFSSNGTLKVFKETKESNGMTISMSKTLLQNFSYRASKVPSSDSKRIFIRNYICGILCGRSISIFSLKDGSLLCESDIDSSVCTLVNSNSPAYLAFVLTDSDLIAIQGMETKQKTLYTSAEHLPDDDLLQTAALKLSKFHTMKQEEYNVFVEESLQKMKESWKTQETKHNSHLFQSIGPLIEDYWKLENLSKTLLDKSQESVLKPLNHVSLVEEVMDKNIYSKRARYSKLVWLSQLHPVDLLDLLSKGLALDGDIGESLMPQWKELLGIDTGDFMTFEFLCRLLFKLHPNKLLSFLRNAESVNEQSVGVTAFLRKKSSLVYYKTASDCLPDSETSTDPKTAAFVKAKLYLIGETEKNVEKALKYLLDNKLFKEAVKLLKEELRDSEMLPTYLHIIVNSLAQNQHLKEMIPDLFELMPSWKSFISFAQIATERPEVRQQQLTTSIKNIFCTEPSDVPLDSVRPHLLKLIQQMNEKEQS